MIGQRVASLFSQLPPRRAVSVGFTDLVRRILDPERSGSYAQVGEDLPIYYYVGADESKFYVDVGCNHPRHMSNTYNLYQRGWRGLCVDANPHLVEVFRKERPQDTVICACIGEKSGRGYFMVCADPALSHLKGTMAPVSRRDIGTEHEVEIQTLDKLFQLHYVPSRFGLLTIDVEGADFAALKSFDIGRYRPRLIVIEIHGLSLLQCSENVIVKYLDQADYALVAYATRNAFFVDRRQSMDATEHA
jgi:FkbM family methyltransferase